MEKRSRALYEILVTTCRCHQATLDPETLEGGWAEGLPFGLASALLTEDELIDWIRQLIFDRQDELAAARWYEVN